MTGIAVAIVDDEDLTRQLHRAYVHRLDGFDVIAEFDGARSAAAGLLGPNRIRADVVLLDLSMPDGGGLDLARLLRARGSDVDIVAVTAMRDAATVRSAVGLGVLQYLVKPFDFATFRDRMTQVRDFRLRSSEEAGPATQSEIDELIGSLRPRSVVPLPKGLSQETLELVLAAMRGAGGRSAAELADRLGMSRVVARRYLELLVDRGILERRPRLGRPGRPQIEYRARGGHR